MLDSLRALLDGHRPYLALVVDRYGDLVAVNDAFGLLTEGVAAELLEPAVNVLGMASRIGNFADWAQHVLERPRRALAAWA